MTIGKKKLLIITFLVFMTGVLIIASKQLAVAHTGELKDRATGEHWAAEYTLKKNSGTEWFVNMEYVPLNHAGEGVYETNVMFADDASTVDVGKGEGYETQRLKNFGLSGTKAMDDEEIREVLKESYVVIKWEDSNGQKHEEKINLH